ncbi:hypothetical protein [Paenibacillus sp.]
MRKPSRRLGGALRCTIRSTPWSYDRSTSERPVLFPLPGGVINVAEKNDWYYMTALPHEFLFTKDHMVGAAFSKLDTVHWRFASSASM